VAKRAKIIGVRWAEFTERPPWLTDSPLKGVQREGQLYEERLGALLEALCGKDREVLMGQWIKYQDKRGVGWCQPDILLMPKKRKRTIYIIEVKRTATGHAITQLAQHYLPVIRKMFPKKHIRLVQICNFMKHGWKGLVFKTPEDMLARRGWQGVATLCVKNVPKI